VGSDGNEAVEVASMTGYGLVTSVHTGPVSRGTASPADSPPASCTTTVRPSTTMFSCRSGAAASGIGHRHGGGQNQQEFTRWQWLTVPTAVGSDT